MWMLIDEILAVGDAAFQAKCFRKLQEVKGKGATIVIVSHSLSQIEQVCERSIWIENGVIRLDGTPRDVHPHYMEWMSRKNQERQAEESAGEKSVIERDKDGNLLRWGSGEVRMTAVTVVDAEGKERNAFTPWEPFTIHIEYEAERELDDAVIGLALYRNDGTMVYGTNTLLDTSRPVTLKGAGFIDLHIDNMPASNGIYAIDLALHRPDGFNYDFWRNICTVDIADRIQTPGEMALPHHWDVN